MTTAVFILTIWHIFTHIRKCFTSVYARNFFMRILFLFYDLIKLGVLHSSKSRKAITGLKELERKI